MPTKCQRICDNASAADVECHHAAMVHPGDDAEGAQPTYAVGDVANGHVWTGQQWIALNEASSSPLTLQPVHDEDSTTPSHAGRRNHWLAGLLVAGLVVVGLGVVTFEAIRPEGSCGDGDAYAERMKVIQAATAHGYAVSQAHRDAYDAAANPDALLAEMRDEWGQENIDSWTAVVEAFGAAAGDEAITGPAHEALVNDQATMQEFLDATRAGSQLPSPYVLGDVQTDGPGAAELGRVCAGE
jgi:hypothetical protein